LDLKDDDVVIDEGFTARSKEFTPAPGQDTENKTLATTFIPNSPGPNANQSGIKKSSSM